METASISSSQRPASEMVGPFVLGLTLGRGQTSKVRLGIHKDTGMVSSKRVELRLDVCVAFRLQSRD